MSETELKRVYKELNKSLTILKERAAKYKGNTPPELLEQIEDHERAIELTQQRLAGELSDETWWEAMAPLRVEVMRSDERPKSAAGPSCALPLVVGLAIVLLAVAGVVFLGSPVLAPYPTPIMTFTSVPLALSPTPTPNPTSTPAPPAVVMAEGAEVSSATRLGQLTVNHPLRMSPGASRSFFASLRIPQQLASMIPVEIEIITVPDDVPIEAGAREEDIVELQLVERMGIELIAPAFGPVTADPLTQTVTLNEINVPTFWSWTLIAPEAPGPHEVELRVYQVVGEQKRLAIPPRIYEIEVAALVPTPVPTPFLQTPLGTTLVGGGITIVVALIGLVGVYLGREHLPLINTKASKRRRLARLRSNLAYLEEQAAAHGALEVPVKLRNEIEATRVEIEAVERELRELEG